MSEFILPETGTRTVGAVPCEVLQEVLERSGVSRTELARRLGWYKTVPNVPRINVALGLAPNSGTRKRQRGVRYSTAARICEALGASPFELGI